MPGNIITEFRGQAYFLSNFYMHPVYYDGVEWPSAEHAYQASKSSIKREKEVILNCETPGQAKRMGRLVAVRKDFEQNKLQIMTEIVRSKFSAEPLRTWLLETADATLVEGNTWGDRFWGFDLQAQRGDNHLGKILMKVREEIRAGQKHKSLQRQP